MYTPNTRVYLSSPDCVEREIVDVLVHYELTPEEAFKVLESVREWIEKRSLIQRIPKPD